MAGLIGVFARLLAGKVFNSGLDNASAPDLNRLAGPSRAKALLLMLSRVIWAIAASFLGLDGRIAVWISLLGSERGLNGEVTTI